MARFSIERARDRVGEENAWRVVDSATRGDLTVRIRAQGRERVLVELTREQAERWRDNLNRDASNVV